MIDSTETFVEYYFNFVIISWTIINLVGLDDYGIKNNSKVLRQWFLTIIV